MKSFTSAIVLALCLIQLAIANPISLEARTAQPKVINPGKSSSKCITASSNKDGAAVTLQDCKKTSNQMWTYNGAKGGASGTIKIFGDKCLDVKNGNTANGAALQIYGCGSGGKGDKNQQWSYTSDDRIAWTNMHRCLTIIDDHTESGTPALSSHCTANEVAQVWYIV